jgi:lipopolysaccharide biosynthesis protein
MKEKKIKAIAFYLPQYHPIPENDRWWGRGFTEWTNVKKSKPLFKGHYQPHVPSEELGYYDLTDIGVIKKQAKMAKEHGVHGFCFYHYWFAGKKLLDGPLKNLLIHTEIDLPFCVCWANENWTRQWDGADHEILISQKHGDEDDRAFINDLIPVFRDDRYIRINNKPVLLIYRTELFPDIKHSANIWRNEMRVAGIGEIYLVKVESFEANVNPKTIGFDATVEFAPDKRNLSDLINFNKAKRYKNVDEKIISGASPTVYDYEAIMFRMILKEKPNYKMFRGVFPSWDNTARRKERGRIIINSSPDNFEYFLDKTVKYTCNNFSEGERLIFINAWNEWGEGCHLEPDKKYGNGFLDACKRILVENRYEKNDFKSLEYVRKMEDVLSMFIQKNDAQEKEIKKQKDVLNFIETLKLGKVRKHYMTFKHWMIFIFLNPRKLIKKYFKI